MGASPSTPNLEKYPRPQVISLGFSRTGTNSMQLALSQLLGDGQSQNVQHGGTDFYVQKSIYTMLNHFIAFIADALVRLGTNVLRCSGSQAKR